MGLKSFINLEPGQLSQGAIFMPQKSLCPFPDLTASASKLTIVEKKFYKIGVV